MLKTVANRRPARLVQVISILLFALMVALAAPPHAGAAVIYPNSMASTGDSITRAFNTGFPFTDVVANSWSTGTNASVNSIYNRILANNPTIQGKNYNDARTGAKVADLPGQVATVNNQHVEYVTILIGANDVCTSSESTMTSVQTFHDTLAQAMSSLATGSPSARVYVVSIPDVYNLWVLFHNNAAARGAWSSIGLCQSMLANPTSTKKADVNRRARVRQRNIDFNTALAEVCSQYPQCRFDGNAVFNNPVAANDVSTIDYFHPSITGQTKLASVAWGASGLSSP